LHKITYEFEKLDMKYSKINYSSSSKGFVVNGLFSAFVDFVPFEPAVDEAMDILKVLVAI
jgi:hypothetical protein